MTTLSACLARTASRSGHRAAVITDTLTLTWQDVHALSRGYAQVLAAHGVGAGDHVALICSNRPAFLIAWFAIAHRGAVMVSLNTGLVGDGLRHGIEHSDAKVVLIERAILAARQDDIAPVLAGRQVLAFDGEDDLFAAARAGEAAAGHDGHEGDACAIIYTSGTTGRPKGVVNSHRAYLACGEHTARLLQLTPDDRIMVFLPLFHANPQMYAVMSALTVGCAIVLRPRFSVSSFFGDARRFGCTCFTYVGTVLAMLASRLTGVHHDHGLRRCIGGGAPVAAWQAIESRFGVQVHELYGMTEIGGWVTANTDDARRVGTCGLARPDMEVRIVDADDRPVPAGTRGEIAVRPRTPFVILSGYYKDPQATWTAARNFWFHTGDAGSLDADGYLTFHGRLREIIRRGGENVSPVEIETALLRCPGVEDAAVVGIADPIFGEEIKAVLVVSSPIAAAGVRAFLAGKIPDFMLPRYVQFVTRIPKTETEKVQRHLVREMAGDVIDLQA
ncbi:ATP-dependent acyl-CoA ligase [Vineibacter terrae]|uniref:ATP-dependent acyl-CoA ligase n=1 Tax=Vineibacter terrae TaxID=2586908 RepID=A0A5C8PDR8_9HYPH|nr:AMP-binding protein [Vineibacter terrae]TXL71882.1 ATP-dependent acyl-CoA ligase [Vineibacter terrae]